MMQAFKDRYNNNGQAVKWNLKDLPERSFSQPLKSQEPLDMHQSTDSKGYLLVGLVVDIIEMFNAEPDEQTITQLGCEQRSIPMHHFFMYCINSLADESHRLAPDYLAIHRSCWTALEGLQKACGSELDKLYYSNRRALEIPATTVTYLLGTLAGYGGGPLLKGPEFGATRREAFRKAATVFREMIESGTLNELTKTLVANKTELIPDKLVKLTEDQGTDDDYLSGRQDGLKRQARRHKRKKNRTGTNRQGCRSVT